MFLATWSVARIASACRTTKYCRAPACDSMKVGRSATAPSTGPEGRVVGAPCSREHSRDRGARRPPKVGMFSRCSMKISAHSHVGDNRTTSRSVVSPHGRCAGRRTRPALGGRKSGAGEPANCVPAHPSSGVGIRSFELARRKSIDDGEDRAGPCRGGRWITLLHVLDRGDQIVDSFGRKRDLHLPRIRSIRAFAASRLTPLPCLTDPMAA